MSVLTEELAKNLRAFERREFPPTWTIEYENQFFLDLAQALERIPFASPQATAAINGASTAAEAYAAVESADVGLTMLKEVAQRGSENPHPQLREIAKVMIQKILHFHRAPRER